MTWVLLYAERTLIVIQTTGGNPIVQDIDPQSDQVSTMIAARSYRGRPRRRTGFLLAPVLSQSMEPHQAAEIPT